ncbi:MAG: hypothetical protein AB1374_12145 [Bacillota bacterium]
MGKNARKKPSMTPTKTHANNAPPKRKAQFPGLPTSAWPKPGKKSDKSDSLPFNNRNLTVTVKRRKKDTTAIQVSSKYSLLKDGTHRGKNHSMYLLENVACKKTGGHASGKRVQRQKKGQTAGTSERLVKVSIPAINLMGP